MAANFTTREFIDELDACLAKIDEINTGFDPVLHWRYEEKFLPYIKNGMDQVKEVTDQLIKEGKISLDSEYSMVPYLLSHKLSHAGLHFVMNRGRKETLYKLFLFNVSERSQY